jgi:long-chain fatty acid transport protein
VRSDFFNGLLTQVTPPPFGKVVGNVRFHKGQETDVKIGDGEAVTENRHFDDTFHGAIGAQYRVATHWLASVGFAYDSSPVTDRRRTPDFPVDRQLRFGTGLRYDWSDDVTIGLGYEFVDLGDADFDVNQNALTGRVQGDFRTNHVNVVTASLIWRFGPTPACGSTC